MRVGTYAAIVLLALLSPLVSGQSRAELNFPKLGLVSSTDGRELWPMWGVPGAAVIGERLTLPFEQLLVPPSADWVLAVGNGELAVLRISEPGIRFIRTGDRAGGRIVFSPTGVSAALADTNASSIEVLTGLPDEPSSLRSVDVRSWQITSGPIAVSDGGAFVLVALPGSGLLSLSQTASVIPTEEQVTAIAFARGSTMAVANAGSRLYLLNGLEVRDLGSYGTAVGVALSSDGRRVFLARGDGTAGWVEIATGVVQTVNCGCSPSGLFPMSEAGLFRLNDFSGGPVFLLDTRENEPRVWFVPVDGGRR